jgi:hypothetical protein
MVRLRLGALGLSAAREEEIRVELAEHLEDAYQDALQCGLSPEAAIACAHEQVPDWKCLAQGIRRAGQEEDTMSHTTKTLWLPGMSVLIFSAVLLLVMIRLVPPTAWGGPKPPVHLLATWPTWLFSYLVFGALGAYWSRRAGGSIAARFLSGTFPLALHLVIFFLPIAVAMLYGAPSFPEHRQVSWLLRTSIWWVVIPGVALAMGTLPFLRDGAERASPASARGIWR